ncbi:MAG: hypothetical protein GXX79_12990 [Actinomycetales bacterium]|nr:hypothetical protein [Actinomycetales bacterium]
MVKRAATPVRFDTEVADRLASYVRTRPGWSLSSATNRLVDEGLRMSEHPGVAFRDGPTGRRAGLVTGPDVWEIVRALRSAREAEPDLDETALVDLVATNTGTPVRLVRIAVRYWAAYPEEIEAEITAATHVEHDAELAWHREHDLLGRRGA